MWKQLYNIKKFNKGVSLNFHRSVLAIKYNTVLIIVYVWGILQSPRTVIDRNWNNPVIFSGRMICPSCISFILWAKQTFRIAAGLYKFCSRNCLRIFFWFGKINRNVNITIWRIHSPFLIFLHTITTNIITILT